MPFKISAIKYKTTYFLLISLIFLLFSCQASFGDRYERGNLEVYYTEEMKDFAIPVANYFENNDLIHPNHKQSIQLTSSPMSSKNPGYILKMVYTDIEKKIPENEYYQVKLLEEDIKGNVFKNRDLTIVLCNENFIEVK